MSNTTPGLVCGHHHLYSALARGMPAPPKQATNFVEILEQVWWRLDVALDLDMLYWSAALAALEALQSGTTAIIDHHESPLAIEGCLSVIADACAMVGVQVVATYGVTDRWIPWSDDPQRLDRCAPTHDQRRSPGLAGMRAVHPSGRPRHGRAARRIHL